MPDPKDERDEDHAIKNPGTGDFVDGLSDDEPEGVPA